MKNSKWIFVFLNLFLLTGYMVYAINHKEKTLADGTLVLFELAPVDPRSLMQGDYMSLNYKLTNDLSSKTKLKRGYIIVALDANRIATFRRVQETVQPLIDGEYVINFTNKDGFNFNIGAESFFFQEGTADKYDKAKYGAIKIDNLGSSLLVGLYDDQRKEIK